MQSSKTYAQDKGFNLTAAKTYNPSTFSPAEKTFTSPVKLTVPQTIPLLEGNAGNHDCNIIYRLDGVEHTINYKGGSDQAHPNSPDQIAKGKEYIFNSCTDPDINPGDIITCEYIKLRVLNGDSYLDETVASLYFQPVMFETANDTTIVLNNIQVNKMTVNNQLQIGQQSIHMQTPTPGSAGDNEIYSTDDLYIQSHEDNEADDDLILVSQKDGDNTAKGKVGIGTITPSEKLEVVGNIKTSGRLDVLGGNTSTFDGNVSVGASTLSPDHITLDGNDMYVNGQFEQNGSGGAYFYKADIEHDLNVKGDVTIYDDLFLQDDNWMGFGEINEGENRLLSTHTGTHGYIDFKDNLHFRADLNWVSALTLYGDGSAGVGFNTTYSAGDYLTQGYKFAVNGNSLFKGDIIAEGELNFNGSLLHQGKQIGLWEKNGSNIAYKNGRVGIGKDPSAPLDVKGIAKIEELQAGEMKFSDMFKINTDQLGMGKSFNISALSGSNWEPAITIEHMNEPVHGESSHQILFSNIDGSPVMRIDGSKTTEATKKDVYISGNLDFTGTLSRNGQELGLWTLKNDAKHNDVLYTDKRIKVDMGPNRYMEFPAYGRFFHVKNNQDVQAIFDSENGDAGIHLDNGNRQTIDVSYNMNNEFVIGDDYPHEQRLIINEEGQVKINSLEVSESVNNVFIGKSLLYEGTYGYGTGYIGFNAQKKSDDYWYTSDDGANNGGVVMYGNIGGDLFFSGIPSTGGSPQSLDDDQLKNNIIMQINSNSDGGNVIVRELRVRTDILPDYVFSKDYELMSLTDLESYINKHQSLPGIPKEKEAVANGIDVGEMQIKLLEKMEELTLHTIEQEKKIEKLEKEKEALKIKNKKIDELEREIDELKEILKK
jgi:hypothetical protein